MTKDFLVIDDLPIKDKTIILRVDFNSPVDPESGKILGLSRIKSHIQTIEKLADSRLIILAHQSKPGKADYISLKVHADILSSFIKRPITFIDDLFGTQAISSIQKMKASEIIMLENVRFYAEEVVLNKAPMEIQRQSLIVQNLGKVSDYFVNDAFAAAHRQQPSLVGFTEVLPSAAGLVMEKEILALDRVLTSDEHPCIAILGGAKVQDSLEVAENMLKNKIADKILTSGVVANVFLMASGYNLGKPNNKFLEAEFENLNQIIDQAKNIIRKYKSKIITPVDLAGNKNGIRVAQYLHNLPSEFLIYDVGLETVAKYSNILKDAKIIIANGPAGVFEIDEFSFGTNEIFYAIANSNAYSVVGGGETLAVILKLNLENDIDHVSTGGGACINYLAGRKLPVIEALKNSKNLFHKKLKINKRR